MGDTCASAVSWLWGLSINWDAWAAVGTICATLVALGGYWFSEWQRGRDRKDASLKHALQIGFKLTVLDADAKHIHQYLLQNAGPDEEKDPTLLWRRLPPELSLEALIGPQLTADEQNLLIVFLEADLLTQITEISARNHIIRKAMTEYRIKRENLQEKSPPPTGYSGSIGSFELAGEDLLKLRPWMSVLQDLVSQMRQLAGINVDATKRVVPLYEAMMRKNFPGTKFLVPPDS
jgi:hypothetical protein